MSTTNSAPISPEEQATSPVDAAANQTIWPYPTSLVVLVKPDPVVRRRLWLIALTAIGLAVILWAGSSHSPLGARLAKQRQMTLAEGLQERMRKAADGGSREAAIWLAQWFPGTDSGRLEPLVALEDPHALYVAAQLANSRGKSQDAAALMKRAAVAGYPQAVAVEEGHPFPEGRP